MDYVSCFSGIGGLEATTPPVAICEIDANCRDVLRKRFPSALQYDDVRALPPIPADMYAGGWPCQDLSVAGKQAGLAGKNSGLFYAFVAAARAGSASTIVAENVPNLLNLDGGRVFLEVISEFQKNGFEYCSWRTINARSLGLPHNRNRVFIIASKNREACETIFRDIPSFSQDDYVSNVAGFYWTAGTQSICYSRGYVPAIKVGSTLSIASPPAVHFGDVVRQLTPSEAIRLQGFSPEFFDEFKASVVYKMAGNAVAHPVGKFVMDGVLSGHSPTKIEFEPAQCDLFPNTDFSYQVPAHGLSERGVVRSLRLSGSSAIARNLEDFIDLNCTSSLSQRAATGLLARLARSGQACPTALQSILFRIANK